MQDSNQVMKTGLDRTNTNTNQMGFTRMLLRKLNSNHMLDDQARDGPSFPFTDRHSSFLVFFFLQQITSLFLIPFSHMNKVQAVQSGSWLMLIIPCSDRTDLKYKTNQNW